MSTAMIQLHNEDLMEDDEIGMRRGGDGRATNTTHQQPLHGSSKNRLVRPSSAMLLKANYINKASSVQNSQQRVKRTQV